MLAHRKQIYREMGKVSIKNKHKTLVTVTRLLACSVSVQHIHVHTAHPCVRGPRHVPRFHDRDINQWPAGCMLRPAPWVSSPAPSPGWDPQGPPRAREAEHLGLRHPEAAHFQLDGAHLGDRCQAGHLPPRSSSLLSHGSRCEHPHKKVTWQWGSGPAWSRQGQSRGG